MTGLLTKLFIKETNVHDPAVRASYGKLSGWIGIVCNIFLFAAKFIAGAVSGSISITADAVNNLSDASSSIISLIGFKMSGKSADSEHPYGHARYEYLSGLIVAVMILVIGVELFKSSLEKALSPSQISLSIITVSILIVSIFVKLWMTLFNSKLGKMINSKTLSATAADSRNDVISTAAVLVAAVISHFSGINLDGWMGLAVALFILYSGIGLVKSTISPLLGQAPDPELVQYIKNTILDYPGVLGTHDLMIHDYGPGRQFASVHVEMSAEENVLESHDVIDNIERDFKNRDNLHMIVHLDPIVTGNDSVNQFRMWLCSNIKTINPALTIHDLRMVPGPTHTNVIFDCVMPHDLNMSEMELKERIDELVAVEYPDYYCVITVDSDYAPITRN